MVEAFRPVQQAEIQRDTEGELPESKIFDLLSSVGNAENKALELTVMREGVIYSKYALWQEVISRQAEDRRWKMNRQVPFKHCEHSLSPIGLVTREALSPDGTAWGYQITPFGLHSGIPFAGILLKWSYEYPEYSFYKMFGATVSTSVKEEQTLEKKRAQETRYKIFWEITTNPSNRIRTIDIANEINEDLHLIGIHLGSLKKNGLISYDVIERGKSFSRFKRAETVPDKDPEPYGEHKTLTARVWNLLSQSMEGRPSKYLSVEDIVNSLMHQYPAYKDLQRRSFSQRTTLILSDLEKQRYLQREKFGQLFRSELTISDRQREAIVSLVTLIDKFKNGDRQTIETGRRFAQRVGNNPNLFSELMLKAKDASPYANQTNREEMNAMLLSVLQEYPNSTTNQITQILEEHYDKRLTPRGTHNNVLRLLKEDLIVSEKTKAGNVYRVVETENNLDVHLGRASPKAMPAARGVHSARLAAASAKRATSEELLLVGSQN